jgi:oligopeptide/dipeptide ABC transporter ATP-binding protein
MRQRVMIAMAIANDPQLIIADEPTTALDVTIQAEVLDVLREVQHATGSALILITHDLGIVAGLADRVVVMYAGRVVEAGTLDDLFYGSRHPYTRGLVASVPSASDGARRRLPVIPGVAPSGPVAYACAFHPRCPYMMDRCRLERPVLEPVDATATPTAVSVHASACWRAAEIPSLASTTPVSS